MDLHYLRRVILWILIWNVANSSHLVGESHSGFLLIILEIKLLRLASGKCVERINPLDLSIFRKIGAIPVKKSPKISAILEDYHYPILNEKPDEAKDGHNFE